MSAEAATADTILESLYWPQRLAALPSDVGNAQRFALDHQGEVLYMPGLGWHVWDGRRWRPDEDGEVMRRAQHTVRVIRDEADALDDGTDEGAKRKRDRLSWALRSEARPRHLALVDTATVHLRLVAAIKTLDADPWALNVANGTLDLRSGTLSPHNPGDRLTRLADVEYDPEAKAPRWERFCAEVFAGDVDLVAYFQRAVGYSLTGQTGEHVVLLPHGPGGNGKSVAMNVVQALLGDYAATADVDTFLAGYRDGGAARPDLLRLRGVRAVLTSETTPDRRFDARLVKAISGGDRIVARGLYRDPIEFLPAFKLWIACNHLPAADGSDQAMWRRLRAIPFGVRFERPDRRLTRRLLDELPGILTWAVRGCTAWQTNGLGTPLAVRQATDSYRQDSDPFGQFLSDRCILATDAHVTTRELRSAFLAWAQDHGHDDISPKRMATALTAAGCLPKRLARTGDRGWTGVTLGLRRGARAPVSDTSDTSDTRSETFPSAPARGDFTEAASEPSDVSENGNALCDQEART